MSKVQNDDYQRKIDRAFELNASGKIVEAGMILSNVLADIPDNDLKSLGLAGSLLHEARDFTNAAKAFTRAVELSPDSAGDSLGLFHALWRLEHYDSALDELVRFMSSHQSSDHELLLVEMKEGFFGRSQPEADSLELIEKIRKSLTDN